MEKNLPIQNKNFTSEEIRRFSNIVMENNCHYYASDFLGVNKEKNLNAVEELIQHALAIFHTLHISTDGHFYAVYRCTPQNLIFKDWKISELACAYMLVKGNPSDLRGIAKQQSVFINEMLRHMKSLRAVRPV
ncbi:hypothetical protein [Fodinibius roseus]|nr:hypothetical protein [Fodinibius roseus]